MSENDFDPTVEWKKSGFDSAEKPTLKVNVNEAIKYETKKKNSIHKLKSPTVVDLPNGLKKIRTKIKDAFDEDDEEDDDTFVHKNLPINEEESNSLLQALNDDEKKFLKRQENTSEIMKSQQNAGKLAGLAVAKQFAKEAGIVKLEKKSLDKKLDANFNGDDIFKKVVKNDIVKKLNVKGEDLSDAKTIQLLRGIKRIKAVGGPKAIEGLKIKEVIKAGEKNTDEKKIVNLIQKKRGLDKNAQKRLEKQGKKIKDNSKILVQKKSITHGLFNDRFNEKLNQRN